MRPTSRKRPPRIVARPSSGVSGRDPESVSCPLNRAGLDGGFGVLSASKDLVVLTVSVEPGFNSVGGRSLRLL